MVRSAAMKLLVRGPDHLVWPQQTESVKAPVYRVGAGRWKRSLGVDPHPCYQHDEERVSALLQACVMAYPLSGPAEMYLIGHEFLDCNNGLSFVDHEHYREDGSRWEEEYLTHDGRTEKRGGIAHTIVLCGKRIPPMPAMTRYLVPHEYGHAVWNQKLRDLGYQPHEDDKLEALYMRMRGEPLYKEPENARWDRQIGEIVANDFRTIVMGQELEFWPHSIRMLDSSSPVAAWWRARTREEMEACLLPFK